MAAWPDIRPGIPSRLDARRCPQMGPEMFAEYDARIRNRHALFGRTAPTAGTPASAIARAT
jgi:hypothetical protein